MRPVDALVQGPPCMGEQTGVHLGHPDKEKSHRIVSRPSIGDVDLRWEV